MKKLLLSICLMLLQSGCVMYVRIGPQEIDFIELTQKSRPIVEVDALEPNTGIKIKGKIDSK